jgi:hypothetical protein
LWASGPWQAKQLFDKIGSTWVLKEIFSPPARGAAVVGFAASVGFFSLAGAGAAVCSGAFLQETKDPATANESKRQREGFIVVFSAPLASRGYAKISRMM